MYRATTPTHKFVFNGLDPSTFKELNVYYAQQGIELLKKTKDDCIFTSEENLDSTDYVVYLTLSQEETKLFKPRQMVKIQLRALTADDRALATSEYEVQVCDVINDEVLE